jgi:hypothetical protein
MHKAILALAAILISFFTYSQPKAAGARQDRSFVREYGRNRTITRLPIKSEPVFQRVNNKLNLSVDLENGAQLQINGIPENLLTDTTLRTAVLNVVYITAGQDTTYVSNTKRTRIGLTINAKSRAVGSPLSILVTARVYYGKQSKLFEVMATGRLPEKEFKEHNKR